MKKIFKYAFAVVAGVAALAACTNEPEEGITPEVEKDYVVVKVGMGENTRTLTDAEGIKWAVGDQIKYAGGVELTSEALTAEDIEDDGYTANFKFAPSLNEVDRTGWFTNAFRNTSEFDFVPLMVGGNVYSQTEAGVMNPDFIFLHSGTGLINITKDVAPEVDMQIAGAIFRIMPYTESYNDEKVLWVEFASNNGALIVGTAMYDRGANKYNGINQGYNDGRSNKVQVLLDTPFNLTNANSRENSKGIYMAIARTSESTPIEGYTYIVRTNKATYTFSSDNTLEVGDNEFKNIYLKLENGVRELAEPSVLTYLDGGIINKKLTVSANAAEAINLGYLLAVVDGSHMRNYKLYPELICVSLEDYNKGDYSNPVNWMNAHLATNNEGVITDCVWHLNIEENTSSEAREGVIIQDWSKSGLYTGENLVPAVMVTQQGVGSTKIVTFGTNIGDINTEGEATSNKQLGHLFFNVDGAKAVDFAGNSHNEQAIYGSAQFFFTVWGSGAAEAGTPVDWVNVYYGKDSNGNVNSEFWFMDIEENNTGDIREAMICCRITLPEGYEFEDGTTVKNFERRLTQYAAGAATNVTFTDAVTKNVNVAKEGVTDYNIGGYCLAYFNGTEYRKWNEEYKNVIFRCISPEDAAAGNYETAPELDWITAEYQHDANGNITDCVWWITVQPNEGAERKAVICSIWPDSDEFTYPDNNRIITSTITQAGTVEGGDDDDEPVSGELVFTSQVMHDQDVSAGSHTLYLGFTNATLDGVAVDLMQARPVCDDDWVTTKWENTNNFNLQIDVEANTSGVARSTKVYVEYKGVRSTNYIVVNQKA